MAKQSAVDKAIEELTRQIESARVSYEHKVDGLRMAIAVLGSQSQRKPVARKTSKPTVMPVATAG